MSLAADVARSASNMNRSLTLGRTICALEEAQGRYVSSTAILELIHDHLSGLERDRAKVMNDERVKKEMAESPTFAEVLT